MFNTRELTPLTYIPGTVKYYANGILQATPAVTAGPPLTITGITVPAGGNVTLTYEAEVNSYAPLAAEASITNTATIAGAGVTPVTVNETVNAVSGPLLTITKSVSPVPVTENGTLTYTFLIQNLVLNKYSPRLSVTVIPLNAVVPEFTMLITYVTFSFCP